MKKKKRPVKDSVKLGRKKKLGNDNRQSAHDFCGRRGGRSFCVFFQIFFTVVFAVMARHERRPFCDNIFVFIYFLFYFAAAVSSATNATHLLRLTIFRANFQRRPQRSLFIILFILFLLCFILGYLLRFWQRWNTVGNGAPFILVFSSAVIVV